MLKSGKIMLGSRGVPCCVRNLSDGGACLQVQTTIGIPMEFEFVQSDGRVRPCRVVWADETKLGVQFLTA
jgi:hypothetical protein